MTDKPIVLISGTAGFVGGRLAEVLHLSQAAQVRAGVRSWSSAARMARFPVEIVRCDIMNPEQIKQAMQGATAVAHCAYTDERDVIVQGTRNMLEAARQVGVKRFVHLSTAEVYGNVRGPIDETHPYQAMGSPYASAKIEAEKICWEYLEKGVPVTVLRPSIVHGPFSKRTMSFAERLQSGNWGTFENYGEGKCNLVYVDDLVKAIVLALNSEAALGQAFNINGPELLTWNQYFQQFNDALGLPPLTPISASKSTVKSAVRDRIGGVTGMVVKRFNNQLMKVYLRGGTASQLMKKVKQALFTTPTARELQNLYSRDAHYVDTKARTLLGYQPQFDAATSFRLCALWLHHHYYGQQAVVPVANTAAPATEAYPTDSIQDRRVLAAETVYVKQIREKSI